MMELVNNIVKIINKYVKYEKILLINEFNIIEQENLKLLLDYILCNENNLYQHQDIHDLAWEEIHTGPWSTVFIGWRHLYSWASLKMVLEKITLSSSNMLSNDILRNIVKTLDMALLIGGPRAHECIHECLKYIMDMKNIQDKNSKQQVVDYVINDDRQDCKIEHSKLCKIDICSTIEHREYLNIISFKPFMKKKVPVIIEKIMNTWPAYVDDCRKWNNLSYLSRVMGLRVIPIEKGSNYMNNDWKQDIMIFDDFLDQYIYPHLDDNNHEVTKNIAYLAQHNIFEQIPELRKDIQIPDLCFVGEDSLVDINIWIGPPGTISPLHYDPKHNILCQVIGCKLIRLYPPSCSTNLYPNIGKITYNTSQVDINNPKHNDLFPLYANTPYFEVLLRKGQSLYIPPKWWHYVESKTVSCSVSFWFN